MLLSVNFSGGRGQERVLLLRVAGCSPTSQITPLILPTSN